MGHKFFLSISCHLVVDDNRVYQTSWIKLFFSNMATYSDHSGPPAVEREIRTATGDSEWLLLTPIGGDLFRLEESSFVTDAVYRDVIRATETEDGPLLFGEVTDRSPLETQSWILSQEVIESEAIQSVLKQVMRDGGNWERVFGGGLILHTSPTTAKAIESQIRSIAADKANSVAATVIPECDYKDDS